MIKTALKLKFFFYFIASFCVVLIRYPLAPFAVLFGSSADGKHLISALRWLETCDNDLSGDDSWKENYCWGDPYKYWNKVRWLWRNGGNYFNYYKVGVEYNVNNSLITFTNVENITGSDKKIVMLQDDAFLYRRFIRFGKRYLEIFFGWALQGPQQGRCKLVFTIRGRTSTN